MFERFTQQSIKVVMLAQEESRRLGHNFVGTEQLLLGLIGEGSGTASKVLKALGVSLKQARVETEKIIARGSGFVAVEIPFTPRSKRAIEIAWDEARNFGHSYVGTEHLLLGIARESEGVGARVLENMNVRLDVVRKRVLEEMNKGGSITEAAKEASLDPSKFPGSRNPSHCPMCKEFIKDGALRCHACNYGLSDDHFKDCDFCKERIKIEAIKCRYCHSMLNAS